MANRNSNRLIEFETHHTSRSVIDREHFEALRPTHFEEVDPQVYSDWYLNSCYPGIPFHDEKIIIDFLAAEAPRAKGAAALLELGCGPVVSHALPFVPFVDTFVLSDYLDSNLELIRSWIESRPTAHNWSMHTAYVLKSEGQKPTGERILNREKLLRSKIRTLVVGDLLSKRPIRKSISFPVVSCFYATEQAASDEIEWTEVIQNISGLVAPGGRLYLSVLRESEFYAIHDKNNKVLRIPVVPITPSLVATSLQRAGFVLRESTIDSVDVSGLSEEGINGVILVNAKKRA